VSPEDAKALAALDSIVKILGANVPTENK